MADEKCIVDPQRDCLGLHKAIALEKQMSEYRTQARETHADMYRRIAALEQSGSAQEARYQAIMDKLTELSVRLNEALATIAALKEKPAKTVGEHCRQSDMGRARGGDRLCTGTDGAVRLEEHK